MGEHLRLWHMDFPPLIAILSELTRGVMGLSCCDTPSTRAPQYDVVGHRCADRARARRRTLCSRTRRFWCTLSTIFLRAGNLFQPVVVEQLCWTVGLFCLLKLCKSNHHRWWIAFGVACGIGLLTKFSMLIFGFATFIAILATPARRWLSTPGHG